MFSLTRIDPALNFGPRTISSPRTSNSLSRKLFPFTGASSLYGDSSLRGLLLFTGAPSLYGNFSLLRGLLVFTVAPLYGGASCLRCLVFTGTHPLYGGASCLGCLVFTGTHPLYGGFSSLRGLLRPCLCLLSVVLYWLSPANSPPLLFTVARLYGGSFSLRELFPFTGTLFYRGSSLLMQTLRGLVLAVLASLNCKDPDCW